MRIPESKRENAYNVIVRDALEGGTTVLLLCACDVDSLAASTLLVSLFKQDQVRFTQLAVSSVEQLEAAFNGPQMTPDIRSVVLIGCGGGLDIGSLIKRRLRSRRSRRGVSTSDSEYSDDDDEAQDAPPAKVAFIIDPILPYSRSNIDDQTNVLVFDAALAPADDVSDDDDSDFGLNLQDDEVAARSRDLYCGKPSAQIMYELVRDMGKITAQTRWLTCLGWTDHWLHGRIGSDIFHENARLLRDEFRHAQAQADARASSGSIGTRTEVESGKQVNGILDYNFPLYRHWSLCEAMRHSRQVAAWLFHSGPDHLDFLFAKMGIPLEQARSRWLNMSPTARHELRSSLEETAGDAGLSSAEVLCRGFIRTVGYSTQLSAVDGVLLLNSVLEPDLAADWRGAASDVRNTSPLGPQLSAGSPQSDRRTSSMAAVCSNFWEAQSVLGEQLRGPDGRDSLTVAALADAVEIQRAISEEGTGLVRKRLLIRSGAVRYAFLPELRDTRLFACSPSALIRLAIFVSAVVDADIADRARRKRAVAEMSKPTLLCATNDLTGTCLIAGVNPGSDSGSDVRMRVDADGAEDAPEFEQHIRNGGDGSRPIIFPRLFSFAARRTETRIIQRSICGSVIEVHKDDARKFVDCIHAGLGE